MGEAVVESAAAGADAMITPSKTEFPPVDVESRRGDAAARLRRVVGDAAPRKGAGLVEERVGGEVPEGGEPRPTSGGSSAM
jgi:hypothetical protein